MKRLKVKATAVALSFLLVGCSGDESDQQPSAAASFAEANVESPSDPAEEAESEAEEPEDDGVYQPATETSPAKNVPLPHFDERIHELTEEGMYAAGKYFFDAVNYATATGEPDALDKISSHACEHCYFQAERVSELLNLGDWYIDGDWTDYQLFTELIPDQNGVYAVNFRVTAQPTSRVSEGIRVELLSEPEYAFGTLWIYYPPDGDQWLIHEFTMTHYEKVQ